MRDINLALKEEISAVERLNFERLLAKAETREELDRIERNVSVNPYLLRSDRDRLLSVMVTTRTARNPSGEGPVRPTGERRS